MSNRTPLIVAGFVFTLVAIMHALRLIYQWQIVIDTYVVPMSFSVIGLIVAAVLALWLFKTSRRV